MRRFAVPAIVVSVLAVGAWVLLDRKTETPAVTAVAGDAGEANSAAPEPSAPARPAALAPASLRGTVLETDGAPAPGAEVVALADGRERARTVAGADGSFRLPALEPGDYVLAARRGDRAAEPLGPVPLAPGEELAGLTLILAPGGSLAGTVIDAVGREPIEGAAVTVAGVTATTDRVGRFRLRGLPPGRAWLRAVAPGYEPREQPLEVDGRAASGLEVALSPGARMQGRVLAASGEPAGGVAVRAVPYRLDGAGSGGGQGVSRADGSFEVESPAGTVRVEASSSAGEAGRSEWFEVAAGAVREGLELRLGAAASLSGTVRGPDGAPIPGAEVRASGPDGTPLGTTASRADGGYGFPTLPAGSVSITAAAGNGRGVAGPVELAEGEEVRLDVSLGAGTISGTVVDAGGRPVPGAAIAAWPEGGFRALAATAAAGPDGAFTVSGLPDGLHRVEAAHGEARGEVRGVAPGTTGVRVAVGGGLLVGSVFIDRAPATDFTLALSPVEPGRGGARATRVLAADGRFRIPVEPGRWEVRAGAPGATTGSAAAEVPAGGESVELRIELARGATIEGVVTDAEGRPIEGARVSTSRFGNWAMARASAFPGAPGTLTGAGGRFTLTGVPAGRVPVFASHPGYRGARPALVEASPGEVTRVELRLVPAEGGREAGDTAFGGVGMAVQATREGVLAFGVIPGGPAYEAGIRNGDRIHAVDGVPVENLALEEIVGRIRGLAGTPVVFELSRPAQGGSRFRAVAVRAELRL